ncbi:hypothetical protein [Nocardioides hwasunensis]|uniref:Uncharacterized protein n=1 Tax=Nocardioides hwasunensis TaxID=397258 RepID=A0ABR8MIK6_9ACTN|nr:hypothetical protein [Nocardioides hwasunensis]MBD3915894.1 hypothetical protein [Nocardioides hwasunensis]
MSLVSLSVGLLVGVTLVVRELTDDTPGPQDASVIAALVFAAVAVVAGFVALRRVVAQSERPGSVRVHAPLWEADDLRMASLREWAFDTLLALPNSIGSDAHARAALLEVEEGLQDLRDEMDLISVDLPDIDMLEAYAPLQEQYRALQQTVEAAREPVRHSERRVTDYLDRLLSIRSELLSMGYSAEAGDLGDALRGHLEHTYYWDYLAQHSDASGRPDRDSR